MCRQGSYLRLFRISVMLLRSHSMSPFRHKSAVIQQSIVIASNNCSVFVEERKIDCYRCAECFEHSRFSE
jgi:hypothetical protein